MLPRPCPSRAISLVEHGRSSVALGCVAAGLLVLGACGVRLNSLSGISGSANLRAEFHLGACPPDPEPGAVAQVGTGQGSGAGRLVLPGGLPLGGAEVALVDAVGQRVAQVRTDGCGRYRFEGL